MKVLNYPLVSVVIPTYKGALTLPRAIDSVISQTYPNIEIIVVDDNEPNTAERKETENVMDSYKLKEQIVYLQHPCNKNGSAARNTGMRMARGVYIAFLDDDDEFLPSKIKSQVDCLEAKEDIWGVCYTKYAYKRNGLIFNTSSENREGDLYLDALMRNLFLAAGSNLFMRRSILKNIGFFDESFKRNQDLEYLVRILRKYKIAYADTFGLIVHMHEIKHSIDYVEVTKMYCETFNDFINGLDAKERSLFDKMINLQLFRYLLFQKKNVKGAFQFISSNKITSLDALRYSSHLIYRMITKKSCGYRL